MGYVLGDQAISFIPEIRKAYNALSFVSEQKYPKLTFPLIKKHKWDLFNSLPEKVRNEVVFCENPNQIEKGKFLDCGECHSCKTYLVNNLFFKFERNEKRIKHYRQELSYFEPEKMFRSEFQLELFPKVDLEESGEINSLKSFSDEESSSNRKFAKRS
jgi:hypothetical protein